jgi:hypothetical protein
MTTKALRWATALVAGVVMLMTAQPAGAAPSGTESVAAVAVVTAEPPSKSGDVTVQAHKDGHCNVGDLCFWWGWGFTGSRVDFFSADADLSDDVYITTGPGQWVHVDNNSRSVWNYDPTFGALLKVDNNPLSWALCIPPNYGTDLFGSFVQNIESFQWVASCHPSRSHPAGPERGVRLASGPSRTR